jgi:hypothetical protein
MSMAVLASTDPRLVISRGAELFAADPVGHNVVGTKLADAVRYGEPGRYWVALLDDLAAGVAVQQPAGAPLAVAPSRHAGRSALWRMRAASSAPTSLVLAPALLLMSGPCNPAARARADA